MILGITAHLWVWGGAVEIHAECIKTHLVYNDFGHRRPPFYGFGGGWKHLKFSRKAISFIMVLGIAAPPVGLGVGGSAWRTHEERLVFKCSGFAAPCVVFGVGGSA